MFSPCMFPPVCTSLRAHFLLVCMSLQVFVPFVCLSLRVYSVCSFVWLLLQFQFLKQKLVQQVIRLHKRISVPMTFWLLEYIKGYRGSQLCPCQLGRCGIFVFFVSYTFVLLSVACPLPNKTVEEAFSEGVLCLRASRWDSEFEIGHLILYVVQYIRPLLPPSY